MIIDDGRINIFLHICIFFIRLLTCDQVPRFQFLSQKVELAQIDVSLPSTKFMPGPYFPNLSAVSDTSRLYTKLMGLG